MKVLNLLAYVTLSILIGSTSLAAQEKLTAEVFLNSISSDTVTLLDVRTAEEYAKASLANAQNIDWSDQAIFEQKTKDLDKSKPLYLFCLSGGRSAKAAKYLREKGFKVYELDGGFRNIPEEKIY